jgi:hypothetical protein
MGKYKALEKSVKSLDDTREINLQFNLPRSVLLGNLEAVYPINEIVLEIPWWKTKWRAIWFSTMESPIQSRSARL